MCAHLCVCVCLSVLLIFTVLSTIIDVSDMQVFKFCLCDSDIGQVDSPLHSTGNLMREKDLQVIGAEKDLAQLFESSSSAEEDNDGGVS